MTTHTSIIFHGKYVLIITTSNSIIEQPSDIGLWVATHTGSDQLLTADYRIYVQCTAAVVVPTGIWSTTFRSSWTS